MSHDAFIATIESALSVAAASGFKRAILTTGRRSERFAQILWPKLAEESFIQIGDFFKMSLESASKKGFEQITLAVFFGKAVKMAQGIPHTHAAKSKLTLNKLSEWALQVTRDREFSQGILSANTARHAFDIICQHYPEVIFMLANKLYNRLNCSPAKKLASTVSSLIIMGRWYLTHRNPKPAKPEMKIED